MELSLSTTQTVTWGTLSVGDMFLPTARDPVATDLAMVVMQGEHQLLLHLSGERAFRVVEMQNRHAGFLKVQFDDVRIDLGQNPRGARRAFNRGVMGIDESGAFLLVDVPRGGGVQLARFGLRDYRFSDLTTIQDSAHWPAEWRILGRMTGSDTPHVIAQAEVVAPE